MPEIMEVLGKEIPVATEAELLEFCNKVREAGGAQVLEALLPSRPGNADYCLIANALNFGCQVMPHDFRQCEKKTDRNYNWFMNLPFGISKDQAEAVAKAVGNPVENCSQGYLRVALPVHIGNAADAFDNGVAFQNFIVKD